MRVEPRSRFFRGLSFLYIFRKGNCTIKGMSVVYMFPGIAGNFLLRTKNNNLLFPRKNEKRSRRIISATITKFQLLSINTFKNLLQILKPIFKLRVFAVISSVNLNKSLAVVASLLKGVKVGLKVKQSVF